MYVYIYIYMYMYIYIHIASSFSLSLYIYMYIYIYIYIAVADSTIATEFTIVCVQAAHSILPETSRRTNRQHFGHWVRIY